MAVITATHWSDMALKSRGFALEGEVELVQSFGKEAPKHVKILQFTNDTGTTIAENSVIEMGSINNCTILNSSRIISTAFSTSRTLDLGIQEYVNIAGTTVTGDIDALVDGFDNSSAASTLFAGLTSGANPSGYRVSGQTQILCKVLGGTMPDAGVITVILEFVPYRG